MVDPGWPLCVIDEEDEARLVAAYRRIYLDEYVRADVRDWAGRRVRFHAPSFGHAFSEASNYRLSAGVHDVPLSPKRLHRIRWIKLALAGACATSASLRVRLTGRLRACSTRAGIGNSWSCAIRILCAYRQQVIQHSKGANAANDSPGAKSGIKKTASPHESSASSYQNRSKPTSPPHDRSP